MNDGNIAMGIGPDVPESELGDVTLETIEGAVYAFPNMNIKALRDKLPEPGARPPSCLVMVNVSVAALTVPFRILKAVKVGEEVLWDAS